MCIRDSLNWMRDVLGPMLKEALERAGEIDLRLMLSQALHMGDECHNRNVAGTTPVSYTHLDVYKRQGETGAFAAPLARVLAIGSTSGSDIVAGIVSGLRLQLEFERSDTPLQLRLPKAAITPPLRVPPTKPTISGQPPCGD